MPSFDFVYEIYPLGLTGASHINCGMQENRLGAIFPFVPHIKRLGADAVYFAPVFSSDSHGYDTRDYRRIDERLGSNADFERLCKALKSEGIAVILDGVFNHVGRGFWAFADVLKNRQGSPYAGWFNIDFGKNSCYNDGFWYEGWEGHYELVKLNLKNPEVKSHIFSCVREWVERFGISGLRLDVAYMLDEQFLKELRLFTDTINPEFILIGEALHGDYNRIVNPAMLHSCTNYECYKGLYSSFNDKNMFEIAHSLARQFGPEQWTLYKGKKLLSFAENHDVTRLSSILKDERYTALCYALLFAMPGIPAVYYGGEWGAEGVKGKSDDYDLRPACQKPEWNELSEEIRQLGLLRKESLALKNGDYKNLEIKSLQLVFKRQFGDGSVIFGLNADDKPARLDALKGTVLLSRFGEAEPGSEFSGELPPFGYVFLRA